MGNQAGAPVTTKHTRTTTLNEVQCVLSGMQGCRSSMEDMSLAENVYGNTLFSVYDGHGSPTVATLAAEMQVEAFQRALHSIALNPPDFSAEEFGRALRSSYLAMDTALRNHPSYILSILLERLVVPPLPHLGSLLFISMSNRRLCFCRCPN
eukprot:m.662406 g.662406  ORF g.662406 m.662406 type:complete len:152 (-) comp58475_c0_seq2:2134-2589(-)